MTFVAAVLGSLLRAVIVTAFVLAVSRVWSRRLNQASPHQRGWMWAFILIPGLIPELLLGYAYTPWVIGRPFLAETVCGILLGLRLLPVGVIAWQMTPPSPLTLSAWHVRRMTRPDERQTWELWRCRWEGPIRHTIPAAAIVGLLAFQEFELAALLKATSWTDWLFTNQQTGQAFDVLVRAAVAPTLLQIGVIAGALWCLRRAENDGTWLITDESASTPEGSQTVAGGRSAVETTGRTSSQPHPGGVPEAAHHTPLAPLRGATSPNPQTGGNADAQPPASVCDPFGIEGGLVQPVDRTGKSRIQILRHISWLWVLIAWGLLIIVPLWSLIGGLPAGLTQLAGQTLRWQGLLRELLGNVAVSVTAACAAWILAAGVRPVIDRGLRRVGGIIAALLCLPGLSGALVLSLGVLTLFQRSELSFLYNTPVMWVLGSMLFLLPRAVLMRLWLHQTTGSAVTIAQSLTISPEPSQRRTGRTLVWRLRDEPQFLAICYLAYSSYLELTLAALLAPTGLPSGLVRLYNALHFGRMPALSAEMVVLLGVPLLFAAVVWGLARKGRV